MEGEGWPCSGLDSWIWTCPQVTSPALHYTGLAVSTTSIHPKPRGFMRTQVPETFGQYPSPQHWQTSE